MGIDKFGSWAKAHVEKHPEVEISIIPDIAGYQELRLSHKINCNIKKKECNGLVDTGAQMVVIGIKTAYSMGLSRRNLIPVGMKI